MKVLFLGEVVGRCGLGVLKNALRPFKKERKVDLIIANGEGATGGFGLGGQSAMTMRNFGVDIITLGEKAFFKPDMVENIDNLDRVLRPANYPEAVPGRGIKYQMVGSQLVCIINTLGMGNFNSPHLNNPFNNCESLVAKAAEKTPFIFYIFHSSTTAERLAMGYALQGKVSAVIGTHSKTLTSDAQILPGGTAYITDTGRCGSSMSVGGFDPETEIKHIRTQTLIRSQECWDKPQMQGLLCEFDDSGKAIQVETIKLDVEVPSLEQKDSKEQD